MVKCCGDLFTAELATGFLYGRLVELHPAIHAGGPTAGAERIFRVRKFRRIIRSQGLAKGIVHTLVVIKATDRTFHLTRRKNSSYAIIEINAAENTTILLKA